MSRFSPFRFALLILLLVGSATHARAHPTPFSYLDLRLSSGGLEGSLVMHVLDLAHDLDVESAGKLLDAAFLESRRDAIRGLLRARLGVRADGRPLAFEPGEIEPLLEREGVSVRLRFATSAAPGRLGVECLLFPYDPEHKTFLNIYEDGALTRQEILDKNRTGLDHFAGNRQGWLAVVKTFLLSGIEHIFTGPDHILFIIGLLLLGGTLARLLTIVTAFTLAHSITLSLAALELVHLSPRLIEPAIALSIVYVGIDNLMVGKSGRDLRALIAFCFGLIHGFGFANVLREFGLPRQALGWSLFSFNFGVEVGQAVIVLIVASLLGWLRARHPRAAERAVRIGSAGVILAGAFWFVQRVFF